MPVLRINATSQGLALHDTPGPAAFPPTAGGTAGNGPVVLMLHGYKYAPSQPDRSPHARIFSDGATGWPAQLGFTGEDTAEGLAIAFGWYARGALHAAHKRATRLGRTLGVLIAMLKAQAPERPVHIVAHSLGAQAALSALRDLPAGTVDRLILLTGACYAQDAQNMLDTPAGRTAEVFNITSRENDLFDLAFERLVAPQIRGDRALGQGIDAANVRTLQLDCPRTLNGLAQLGFEVAAPRRRICHWSAYTRPGVMALYARLLRDPQNLPLTAFDTLLPAQQDPRWSRLTGTRGGWPALALPRGLSLALPRTLPRLPLALRAPKRMMPKTSLQRKPHEHAY